MNTTVEFKKEVATPASKVVITKIRKVGTDNQTYSLELRQSFAKPVKDSNGLLGLTMAGNNRFSKLTITRVTWQNFSKSQVEAMGLGSHLNAVDAAGRDGVKFMEQPLPFNFIYNGEVLEAQIVEKDSLEPRRWTDSQGIQRSQQPKTAGTGGDILTYEGRPIYKNTAIALRSPERKEGGRTVNMSFEDEIIPHNNPVRGSSSASLESRAVAGSAANYNQGATLGAAILAAGSPAAEEAGA